MSRHYFKTNYQGELITVTMGYDRPLNYVFMTISRDVPNLNDENDDESGDNELVYSNLSDAQAGVDCHDVNYYRQILQTMNLSVPESLFVEVTRDQHYSVGNRIVEHTLGGTSIHPC
jgi:hypothetical protein